MTSPQTVVSESTNSQLKTGIFTFQGSLLGEQKQIRTTVSYRTLPYALFQYDNRDIICPYKEYEILTIWGKPIPKPRETQRDRWAERPSVMRFRFLRDVVRGAMEHFNFVPSEELGLIYYMQMPKLSKKKIAERQHTAHRVRPDLDNLEKATVDALFVEDSVLYRKHSTKMWSVEPRTEIYNLL